MRCLWIGRDCPYPADSGDVIYSSRLLETFRDAGAQVTVLCRARTGDTTTVLPPGIGWHLVQSKTRRGVGSLLSRSPNIGHRHNTSTMRQELAEELDGSWDVILFDHIGSGWALPQVRGHLTRHPETALVYLSQNHEASTRMAVARNAGGNPVRRWILRFDARKAATLERTLVVGASLVTVVTPSDAERFAADAPATPTLVLLPGYSDRIVASRTIDASLPRQVVVLGSFDWLAKRMNLEELLAAADARFAAAGVELVVVGRGPDDWLAKLRSSSRSASFTGFVDSVVSHLDGARVGLVAERTGGGFKLKVLHYVFNRVPIVALADSMSGVPLVDGTSVIETATIDALVDAVLEVIDDPARLDALQRAAFDACADDFDWSTRGQALFEILSD
jgi:glycosyltransferase involved in cell wall biosynthesis